MNVCLSILLLTAVSAIKSVQSLSTLDAISNLDDQTVQVELRAKTTHDEAGHSTTLLLNAFLDIKELYRIVNVVARNHNVKVNVEVEGDNEEVIRQNLQGYQDQKSRTNDRQDGHFYDAGSDVSDESLERKEGLDEEWEGKKDKIVLPIHDDDNSSFEERYDKYIRRNEKLDDIMGKQDVIALVRSLRKNPQALGMFVKRPSYVVLNVLVDLLVQLKARVELAFGEKSSPQLEGLNLLQGIVLILEETVELIKSSVGSKMMNDKDALLDELQRHTKTDKDTRELVLPYKEVKALYRDILLDNLMASNDREKSIVKHKFNHRWTSLLKDVLETDLKDYNDGTVMNLLTQLTRDIDGFIPDEKPDHVSKPGIGEEQKKVFKAKPKMGYTNHFDPIEENYHISEQKTDELRKNFNTTPYNRGANDHVSKQSINTKEREANFNEKPDTEDTPRFVLVDENGTVPKQDKKEEHKSHFNGTPNVPIQRNDHVLKQGMEELNGNFTNMTNTRDTILVDQSKTGKVKEKHGVVGKKEQERNYSEYRRNAKLIQTSKADNAVEAEEQSRMTASNLYLTKEIELGTEHMRRGNPMKIGLIGDEPKTLSNATKLWTKARKFMDAQGDSSSQHNASFYVMDDLIGAVNKVLPRSKKGFGGRKFFNRETINVKENVTSLDEN